MASYSVKWTWKYPGGHAADPGYRIARVVSSSGHEFSVGCDPDGSNIRRISSYSERTGKLTNLSAANAAKRAPKIEEALKAWVAEHGSDADLNPGVAA